METNVTCELVPEAQRSEHVGELFGVQFPMRLEPFLYWATSQMAPDYKGAYWQFYTLSMSDIPITERQQDWLDHIQAAEAFDASIADYAGSEGLKSKELYSWQGILVRGGLLDVAAAEESAGFVSALGDDPDGVNDAGNITKQGEQDVDPEMFANAFLQEDAERRQNNRYDDA